MNQMKLLEGYVHELYNQERATATIQKYVHDVREFLNWCGRQRIDSLSKEQVIHWRREQEESKAPATVNAAIAAVNSFLRFIGRDECCVRSLKVQRALYRERRLELSREAYFCLLRTAERISEQTACMLETICATGIRVSELRYVTVQAIRKGLAIVRNRGKCRTILLPERLRSRLFQFCQACGLTSGAVFIGRHGQPISRYAIWRRMKQLCAAARVTPGKVFPHNLRHLFAVRFYQVQHDLEHLADILGHSNVNTTRIYTKLSGEEHRRQMDALMLTRS